MFRKALLAILFLFFCTFAQAAITLDAQTTAEEHDTPNSLTTSFTVASNDNRMLVVFVHNDHTGVSYDTNPNSVTWNGTGLTQSNIQQYWSNQASGSIWYLIAPETGTHDIVTTYATSYNGHFQHHIRSLYNVAQQAPEASSDDEFTSTTVTTVTNNAMVVAGCGRNQWTSPDMGNPASSYTNAMAQWDNGRWSCQSRSAIKIVTTAGNETPSCTSSDARVVVAAAFAEASAATATLNNKRAVGNGIMRGVR